MTPVDPDNEATFHVCFIPSSLCYIEVPQRAILRDLKRCHFDESAMFGIKLALEEALTNAVKHGNCCDPDKFVTVRYAVTREKAVFVVRDEGAGFEPACVPDPTTPDRLPQPNGRGILLIRAYMDEVKYRDHGRELVFIKRRD
jgi:serine/threonine-protein kinase RsbW